MLLAERRFALLAGEAFQIWNPMVYPQFVDHLVFRVADLSKTERFYTVLLGQPPHRTEDSIMYQVGHSRVFFTLCNRPEPTPYTKEEVGLNHLAFGVRTLEELQVIQEQLGRAGIPNSGIKKDRYGQKEFIWLDDPDNIRMPTQALSQRNTLAVDHHQTLRPLTPLSFSDSGAPFFAGAKLPSRNDSLHFSCWR